MNTNFYLLLDCNMESSLEDIKNGYKSEINKIKDNNREVISNPNKKLSIQDQNNIKLLKIAKYILTNKELRSNYNKMLIENNKMEFSDINLIRNNQVILQSKYQDPRDGKDDSSDINIENTLDETDYDIPNPFNDIDGTELYSSSITSFNSVESDLFSNKINTNLRDKKANLSKHELINGDTNLASRRDFKNKNYTESSTDRLSERIFEESNWMDSNS